MPNLPMHARGGPSTSPLLSLPLCLGEAQNDGQWVQLHGAEAERFRRGLPPCCGAQAEHQMPSPAGCRSGGMQELGARGCSCKRILNRTHEWRPRGCRLVEWNATRFCQVIGRRVVAMVGDSTMRQQWAVLSNYVAWGAKLASGQQGASGCAGQLRFFESDTILGRPLGGLNRGMNLRDALLRSRADVALLSAGSHISTDADLDALLRTVLTRTTARFPNTSFVWKTAQGAGCAASVLDKLPAGPDDPFWTAQANAYNWRTFAGRDALAKRYFADARRGGTRQVGGVLDTTPMNYRADTHISSPGTGGRSFGGKTDCTHQCYGGDGGPLGLGPRLLLHALETGQLTLLLRAGHR